MNELRLIFEQPIDDSDATGGLGGPKSPDGSLPPLIVDATGGLNAVEPAFQDIAAGAKGGETPVPHEGYKSSGTHVDIVIICQEGISISSIIRIVSIVWCVWIIRTTHDLSFQSL